MLPCIRWEKKVEEEKSCCRLGNCSTRAQRKLSAQIAFLELIISFYVIHLSVVIVCQSNAVATRYEVECKFCLGNSFLCTKKKNGEREGWPHCRIYIYNYSHDTIISHHNSSAQDVSADREGFAPCIPNSCSPALVLDFIRCDLHSVKHLLLVRFPCTSVSYCLFLLVSLQLLVVVYVTKHPSLTWAVLPFIALVDRRPAHKTQSSQVFNCVALLKILLCKGLWRFKARDILYYSHGRHNTLKIYEFV